ncbi:F-box/LRR-repeat protein 5 [Crotalus adamanteus]|uniref:F-box/LRR-repeat protein 5 n=1 Tax=Crotalus adamanteus TaxID=8729 RepID=A0AAW1BAM7_CROAD
MAPFPEEVDVFTAPHWRMKQLVGLYCDKLSKTNFSNNNDFRALLQSLYATFKEFKMHEQIENEYIIGLLQQRSQTVYNVHSDNKLSEMLSLFEKGLKNVKNEYEQLNYAKQLKERLEAFTRDFLPHMKEEEEVFQPMLMEYFTYEELKDIKKKVIAQHCSQKETAAEIRRGISLWNQAEELQKVFKYSVDEKADHETEEPGQATSIVHLPSEVMLTIFSYLSPQELCRCSQVSTKWSQLAKTGFLWKHLYPVHWARGNWSHGPPGDLDTEPDEEWVKNRKDETQAFHEWDEDADIDESEENGEESLAISILQKEKNLLQGIIHNILPRVGSSVKTIVLAYSSAISNKMVRHILELCPNMEYLDLTQTDISDSAFESWSWIGCCKSLQHLDLSGCERITDTAVRKISKALGILSSHEALPPSPGLPNHAPWTNRQIEGKDLTHLKSAKSDQKKARVLQFLSLSGCYQITDNGLRMLTLGGGLPYLEHLNLSGCQTVTSAGLQDLVSVCPSLNHEHFYYCDNINGPHAETASGCQNLQCGFRACCRSALGRECQRMEEWQSIVTVL